MHDASNGYNQSKKIISNMMICVTNFDNVLYLCPMSAALVNAEIEATSEQGSAVITWCNLVTVLSSGRFIGPLTDIVLDR